MAEEGTGAKGTGDPPLDTVYQPSAVPTAVRAVVGASSQYTTGLVTEGASGSGCTVTGMAVRGLSQPATVCVA